MSDKLAQRDQLAVRDSKDLFKAVADDIAKEVSHHIEIMYPAAVKAASSTFLLSVRGCVYNEIMAAIDVDGADQTVARLEFRKRFRRYSKAQYRAIRKEKVSP